MEFIRAYLLKQGPLFINIQVLSGEAGRWFGIGNKLFLLACLTSRSCMKIPPCLNRLLMLNVYTALEEEKLFINPPPLLFQGWCSLMEFHCLFIIQLYEALHLWWEIYIIRYVPLDLKQIWKGIVQMLNNQCSLISMMLRINAFKT